MTRLSQLIDAAATALAEAGVAAPRVDAELLAAHATGTDRGRLRLVEAEADPHFAARYGELVARRAQRVPLQHLIGTAPFGPVDVRVGPGVFIPRPETEALLEWALAQRLPNRPLIVDLCTGSGALALALANNWPDARIIAVDDSAPALEYARRNLAETGVEIVCADVTEPGLLPELEGSVDLLVANPPYIPDGARLEPEVAEYDPAHALFGGSDGMRVINAIADLGSRWLRIGGLTAVEHDDTTSGRTVECFERTQRFDDITARRDLAGRPRFVSARRTR
ncbi:MULTISPECIES: peptide chain release factor N(5)-glutamine methyltransferase [unclassified Mycobacterium]|uniref:peptide chain release factor N(5)-glutamine methyltransferase n=1 Tax=unclassified Mycobacterium TaxID=2642494 RepID=UPI000740003A|nr:MULTISPECIES: peptide chain release factor N(5)-glutamine methyltransferase [unclassified Mycobacterium]KUH86016.1 protein-(glutamine-N5) methyltransferase, release factor-specific [Mycobacterium sp. GA-1999]KUH86042.1 protein-(glutamine-N5) methyltransferase, release factor-specific [Mycobacterium sp. GA-0227b]KUH88411.1 protein-(glutamine-N5) methyltransferase, release factor-specific [Mycobacterium sp. IS-1556]